MAIKPVQFDSALFHSSPAPARNCTCGLSAFYGPPLDGRGISGVIAVSGRAILHDDWLRVEFARVECLTLSEHVVPEHRRTVVHLAAEWGIPIVGSGELPAFARELGTEVPRLIRPKPRMSRLV
jgi:hypothetical protein